MKLFAADPSALDFQSIAREFGLSQGFSDSLHAHAAAAEDRFADQRVDLTGLPFVTIDPAGAKDLDQATYIEPDNDNGVGWRVYYAIADVMAFIAPGSLLEKESLRRGQTVYLPDTPVRLYPPELSEDRASLLPSQNRPAVVWDIRLLPNGELRHFTVYRALVRSSQQLDYDTAQQLMKDADLPEGIQNLPAVGRARLASAARRHAINLRLPSVRISREARGDANNRGMNTGDANDGGQFHLRLDSRHSINDYNAELSLLAGMCAGLMMTDVGFGVVRTLAAPGDNTIRMFDIAARALGFDRYRTKSKTIGELLASVEASSPRGMALMRSAQELLRGADYQLFGKGLNMDARPGIHAGVGGYYSHVTAPLRRLVDRYATEICLALAAGRQVPVQVMALLPMVMDSMRNSGRIAGAVNKACLRRTEAVVLEPHVGTLFEAVVLHSSVAHSHSTVFVSDPPMLAACHGAPREGSSQLVTLVNADSQTREVSFAWTVA